MRRLVFIFYILFPLSVFATDTCPAGYHPAEYIELEYIESTGTQYIDTGIKNTNLDTIEITAKNTGTITETTRYLFGVGNTSTTNRFAVFIAKVTNNYGIDTTSVKNRINSDINGYDNLFHTHKIEHNNYFIDGKLQGQLISNVSSDLTSYIFKANQQPTTGKNEWQISKYFVARNNVPIQNLIPVKRISDNAIGMYDRVSSKFYGNDGTGEFIAGPELKSFITGENGDIVCVSCPANTYKPSAGNEPCTKCPEHTFSPVGSKELSDCAKILRVKDYVVYMPLGKRTEHGLCVMVDDKKYCADVYERQ